MATTLDRTAAGQTRDSRWWRLSLSQAWACLAVVLAVAWTIGRLDAVDLAYQIRAGDLLLSTHHFIRTDTFSFTAHGLTWIDQQWAAQALFALVFRHLGWAGLALLKGLLVGTTFALVYLASRAAGAPGRPASWLTIGSFAVAATSLGQRPQLIAAVLFALTLWLVAGRGEHPWRLWLIPAVVAVWANVHGTFFLAPILLGLAWVEDWLGRAARSFRTLAVAGVSVAAATLNPFGLRVWSYIVDISTNSTIKNSVLEWRPPSIRHVDDALFFVSVAAVVMILARRGRPAPWPALLTFGVFFFLGLTATRNTLWWGLAFGPTLAGVLKNEFPAPRRQLAPNVLNTAIAGVLVAAVVIAFPWSFVGKPADRPGTRVSYAPQGITADLERVLRPGDRVFNAQSWGSWLEFALPRNPTFVDSRIEVFPDAVWRDYNEVSGARQGWQRILLRWRVKAVVVSRQQQPGLIPAIRRDPGWRLAYHDADGLVYLPARPLPR